MYENMDGANYSEMDLTATMTPSADVVSSLPALPPSIVIFFCFFVAF